MVEISTTVSDHYESITTESHIFSNIQIPPYVIVDVGIPPQESALQSLQGYFVKLIKKRHNSKDEVIAYAIGPFTMLLVFGTFL